MTSREIPVKELVKREPITVPKDMKVNEAAALMRNEGIGSLIVVENNRPIGIVTERDILTKLVATDKTPHTMKVADIMSAPLISISPNTSIYEAARKMAALNIRRLPIMETKRLIGLVSESDLLRISPELIEVTREYLVANGTTVAEAARGLSGYCESCKCFSDNLTLEDGMLLCSECLEMRK